MNIRTLPIIYLITVWGANINDLIRGNWFFHSWQQVLFWNFIGIISMLYLLYTKNPTNKN